MGSIDRRYVSHGQVSRKKFVHELSNVECVDSQRVRIQEIADDGVLSDEGRVPRFMDCNSAGR